MLSDNDYKKIAEKILTSLGENGQKILADHDKFGSVLTEVMIADWKYDPEKCKPSGSLEGYRAQRVKWVINRLLKKPNLISLDMLSTKYLAISKNDLKEVEDEDLIQATANKLNTCPLLSNSERLCAEGYFVNRLDLGDISKKLNMPKYAIKEHLKKAVKKLGVK